VVPPKLQVGAEELCEDNDKMKEFIDKHCIQTESDKDRFFYNKINDLFSFFALTELDVFFGETSLTCACKSTIILV
jgi:hypothetical protein